MYSQIIYSTFKWPVLYAAIEFPLLIAEVIGPYIAQVPSDRHKWQCICADVGAGHYAKSVPLESWFPETLVFHAVLAWIVTGALSLTICFRIGEAICSRGQSLIRPFDILAYEPKFPQSNHLKKGWKSTFHILFGRSIWKKNFVWVDTPVYHCVISDEDNIDLAAKRYLFEWSGESWLSLFCRWFSSTLSSTLYLRQSKRRHSLRLKHIALLAVHQLIYLLTQLLLFGEWHMYV